MCRGGFNLLQQINQCVTHNEYNWIRISISHSTSIWSSRTTALSVNTHQLWLDWFDLTTEDRNRKSGKYKDNGCKREGESSKTYVHVCCMSGHALYQHVCKLLMLAKNSRKLEYATHTVDNHWMMQKYTTISDISR